MMAGYGEKWYTVYNAETDELVVFGTAKDCARYFGVGVNTFHCMVSHARTGRSTAYCIVVEDLSLGTYQVIGADYTGPRFNHTLDKQKARALWAKGLKDAEIGEQLGVSPRTVQHWRQKNGLSFNGKPGRPRKEAK